MLEAKKILGCIPVVLPLLLSATTIITSVAPAIAQSGKPITQSSNFAKQSKLGNSSSRSRGTFCLNGKKALTPLLPAQQLGLTLAEYPTFFWFVPQSSATTARFLLLGNDDTEIIYEGTFALPKTSGIVGFTLPKQVAPLKLGKPYHWHLVVNCDDYNQSANPGVDGWIQRIQPSATLSKTIRQTPLRDRPALYASHDIWYEAFASLAILHSTNPNNPEITARWKALLDSVGLNAIAAEPLLACCTNPTISARPE